MKNKKLLLPIIVIVAAVIASVAFSCVSGIVKKPQVEEQEFPFSITYKFNSEIKTINGTYVCKFSSGDTVDFEQSRYWDGYVKDKEFENDNYCISSETEEKLYICPNIYAGYVMGDPLSADYYSDSEPYKPYGIFYDNEGAEKTDAETIKAKGLEILSWEYPEPIKNEFVFSHISPISADSVITFVLISSVALVLCIIFVKRDKEITKKPIDKISAYLNFAVGIVILPFITICSAFSDINGGGKELIYQIVYCIPAVCVLGLALSVSLRRTGFCKSSMVVQFVGPLIFLLMLIIAGI